MIRLNEIRNLSKLIEKDFKKDREGYIEFITKFHSYTGLNNIQITLTLEELLEEDKNLTLDYKLKAEDVFQSLIMNTHYSSGLSSMINGNWFEGITIGKDFDSGKDIICTKPYNLDLVVEYSEELKPDELEILENKLVLSSKSLATYYSRLLEIFKNIPKENLPTILTGERRNIVLDLFTNFSMQGKSLYSSLKKGFHLFLLPLIDEVLDVRGLLIGLLLTDYLLACKQDLLTFKEYIEIYTVVPEIKDTGDKIFIPVRDEFSNECLVVVSESKEQPINILINYEDYNAIDSITLKYSSKGTIVKTELETLQSILIIPDSKMKFRNKNDFRGR